MKEKAFRHDQTYSLATASHSPSGERAKSRGGAVHRISISSMLLVVKEYFVTSPSSLAMTKKSLAATAAR